MQVKFVVTPKGASRLRLYVPGTGRTFPSTVPEAMIQFEDGEFLADDDVAYPLFDRDGCQEGQVRQTVVLDTHPDNPRLFKRA